MWLSVRSLEYLPLNFLAVLKESLLTFLCNVYRASHNLLMFNQPGVNIASISQASLNTKK